MGPGERRHCNQALHSTAISPPHHLTTSTITMIITITDLIAHACWILWNLGPVTILSLLLCPQHLKHTLTLLTLCPGLELNRPDDSVDCWRAPSVATLATFLAQLFVDALYWPRRSVDPGSK